VTFADISAMHAGFCMKFYTTAKQSNIRFSTKFCLIISENDKIMLFEPIQIPISQLSSTRRNSETRQF